MNFMPAIRLPLAVHRPLASAYAVRALLFAMIFALLVPGTVRAQQPADLEDYSQVIPGQPNVIDGIWRIEQTGDRVLIENGHAFALDSWVHLLLWEVSPGMRTATDIRLTGIGTFSSYDDLLKRQMFYELREDGSMRASGRGLFAPVYSLLPVELIYPDAFEEELAMLGQPLPRPLHVPLAAQSVMPPDPAPAAQPIRPDPLLIDRDITYPIMAEDGTCLSQLAGEAEIQGGRLLLAGCGQAAGQGFLYLDGDGLLVTEGGMCLEALGDRTGAPVSSFGCDANDRQVWLFEEEAGQDALPAGFGFAGFFRNARGLCLAAANATNAANTGSANAAAGLNRGLALGECDGPNSQLWMMP